MTTGNGEHEADWGVEQSSSDESDAPRFAPSGNVKSRGNSRGLRPLRMSQYGSGRYARFFELFSVRHRVLFFCGSGDRETDS
jgi:hypothetical protein